MKNCLQCRHAVVFFREDDRSVVAQCNLGFWEVTFPLEKQAVVETAENFTETCAATCSDFHEVR